MMTLIRWDQLREFEEMNERLIRAYGRQAPGRAAEGGKEALTVPDWAPAVDIAETPEEFLIKAELPEVKKEDVKVTVENGVLLIEGERRQEREENSKKFHRIERAYGSFVRTFMVPDNIDEAKVSAEFKDGLLNVHLPKTEKAKHKAIEVMVG
jgi:HSP20 family protein